jgi:hypothetical protein
MCRTKLMLAIVFGMLMTDRPLSVQLFSAQTPTPPLTNSIRSYEGHTSLALKFVYVSWW